MYLPFGLISDMYGPHFLILYGGVIVTTLIASWWAVHSRDRTEDLPRLPLPDNPDPYEIAYLRGGENEVTRLVMFDLIQAGYLEVVEEPKSWWQGKTLPQLAQVSDQFDLSCLSPIQREAFESCASPRKASDIFATGLLPGHIRQHCQIYEQRLQNEQLLCPETVQDGAVGVGVCAALVILGLGGFKLVAALSQGHSNVLFLIGMAIVSCIILAMVCKPNRLSRRGQKYLARLEQAHAKLRTHPEATENASHGRELLASPRVSGSALKQSGTISALSTDTSHHALLLSVGLFGVGVLAHTPYGYYEEMFHKGASGGVFGGCGGGGCGGGCGGGGCGGCGG